MSESGSTHCRPPFLVERKTICQVLVGGGEWPSSLVVAEQKEESLSEHHDLAKGWPMVNLSRSCCAAVGWKMVPLSAVASLSGF
jgi:hypothetical protein